jgi:hypothetical protein
MPSISPDHPKLEFMFFINQDLMADDIETREKMRGFVFGLAELRHWVNGPPTLIHEWEDPRELQPGDRPMEILGGFIELYSSFQPWSLPNDIDRQHLEEVEELIKAVSEFSQKHGLTIEFSYDGESCGSIEHGKPDLGLTGLLIGEWRRRLDVSAWKD